MLCESRENHATVREDHGMETRQVTVPSQVTGVSQAASSELSPARLRERKDTGGGVLEKGKEAKCPACSGRPRRSARGMTPR
eukprot:COSAG03_NODE_2942_length_2334_cov_50.093792_2_plen_82_part_00